MEKKEKRLHLKNNCNPNRGFMTSYTDLMKCWTVPDFYD